MIIDLGRRPLPFDPGVLEVANQFPLFGVHAYHRITAPFEEIPLPADVAELPVAVGAGTGGDVLAIGTQRKLHLPQQTPYRAAAYADAQPLELRGDLRRGFSGPLQSSDWIAGCFPLHQLLDGS